MLKYMFPLLLVVMVWAYISLTPEQPVAPDFELPRYPDKQILKLSSMHDRIVLLNFWASWCTVCRKEKHILKRLKQEHPELLVLEVLTHDDTASVDSFPQSFLYDIDNHVADLYKVSSLPQTFLIDKQRHVRWHSYNPIDTSIYHHLAALLNELLKE